MTYDNPFSSLPIRDLFENLLPDFILAFAFFTALVYGVLARRFQHQRPAVTVSATVALALSVGLVCWEQRTGFSIRDLGPFAVGLAIIVLAAVMYQAIRQVGGSRAGIGIALGASLLISKLIGADWPIDPQVIQTVIIVALVVGILAFLMHLSWHYAALAPRHVSLPPVKHDLRDIQQDHLVSDRLDRRFHELEQRVDHLHQHPADGQDILLQLKRMLPAEGWLMPQLRETAGVGPGYDYSAVPGRAPLERERRGGDFYRWSWEKLLALDPATRASLVHVETWNEFHEGTDVCHSKEYGRQYIELTRRYAGLFHARGRIAVQRSAN